MGGGADAGSQRDISVKMGARRDLAAELPGPVCQSFNSQPFWNAGLTNLLASALLVKR
jgi:hypothetical protein